MSSEEEKNIKILTGIFTLDNKVITQIFRENFHIIRKFVLRNSGRKEDVRELMSDAIIIIAKKKERPVITSKFSTYFYGVCNKLWLKKLARQKKYINQLPFEENGDYTYEEDSKPYSKEQINFVREYIGKLSDNCRKVILLYNHGLSIKELTVYMKYKSDQITQNKRSLCIAKLRKLIETDRRYKELKNE
ncbi:MAG: sigma-70 family RNA polymerase sigma factor [Bacteroidota bacterium]